LQYVLVNKLDEIVDKVEMSDVGLNGAKTYFVGRKQIEVQEFDKLWKVMSRQEYDTQFEATNRKPSSVTPYQWWEEDKVETDEALNGKDGLG
jgi:hypothetical protein